MNSWVGGFFELDLVVGIVLFMVSAVTFSAGYSHLGRNTTALENRFANLIALENELERCRLGHISNAGTVVPVSPSIRKVTVSNGVNSISVMVPSSLVSNAK